MAGQSPGKQDPGVLDGPTVSLRVLILSKKIKIAFANSEQPKLGVIIGNRDEHIRFSRDRAIGF
jgi:hypothetical protein